MQVTHLSTGCLLSLIGVIATMYFIYFSKQFTHKKSTHLLTSQSISTILIGLFYIYASLTMPNLLLKKNTFDNLPHFDLIDNSNTTNEYKFLQQPPTANKSAPPMCIFETAYLKEAMLAYSFIQGFISLIAVALDCKECIESEATDTNRDLEGTSSTTEEKKPKINFKQLSLALTLPLSPIIFITSLYFIMKSNSSIIASNTPVIPLRIDNIEQFTRNISTPSNETQVDEVIENIYRLLSVNTSAVPHYNLDNSTQTVITCNTTNLWKKVFAFILFVIGFSLILIYTQTIYLKTKIVHDGNLKTANFKKAIIGFGLMWLPSALDMLVRTHFTYELPGLVSESFLALGNAYNALSNIVNVLTMRKIVQQQNNIEPIEPK